MKKITLLATLTFLVALFSTKSMAQTDYTYTLQHNGGYSFSVLAVQTTTTSSFATLVQSYGFTIFLPIGSTATITSSLGSTAGATPFTGDQVGGSASEQGYLITETLSAPINLPAPSANTNSVMVTFTVNGNPSSGDLRIMALNDPESTAFGGALIPFLTADTTDDGSFNFDNRIINSTTGLSGMSTFSFATLSTETQELKNVSIYPNPVKNRMSIRGVDNIEALTFYNINGQKVLEKKSNFETINLNPLSAGVYILKIKASTGQKILKFIKE